MLFEPILLQLDTPRKYKLSARALMRAEKKINELRGARPNEYVSIDYLIYSTRLGSVMGTNSLPRDLAAVLLWAGLLDFWSKPPYGEDNPELTVEYAAELMEQSALARGDLLTQIFEHYAEVVTKGKNNPDGDPAPAGNGADQSPLAQRPGSTSGATQ